MTKEREALKLALAVLKAKDICGSSIREAKEKAIAAAEEALAQPEQEPVAYCWKSLRTGDLFDFVENKNDHALKKQGEDFPTLNLVLLYTTPPQRKPLTDEQISDIWCRVSNTDFVTADTHEFARAIEAAHGIKGDA